MAASQDKAPFMPPLHEQEQEGGGVYDYYEEHVSTQGGCDCFPFFWRRSNDHSQLLHDHEGDYRESWWTQKLKKVKEVSEVCAGPKWKTFIRKVGGYVKRNKYRNTHQYDPQSYALNFDNGVDS